MPKPNVLIFMTDHQRGDTVPPYGRAITPNVDKLAAEGVSFSQAFCPSPHCCPSRATFMTGLYPTQHSVWHNVDVGNAITRGLAEGVRTWSEDFRDVGYRMYYSGKWHVSLTEGPIARGWQMCGEQNGDYSQKKPQDCWSAYKKAAEQPERTERRRGEILRPGFPNVTLYGTDEEGKRGAGDTKTTAAGVHALSDLAAGARDQPWCLFVGPIGPHDPYRVQQKYLDMYDINDIELPLNFSDEMQDKPSLYRRTRDWFDQLSEEEHREALLHFMAYCTFEDDLFGRLMAELEKNGQADNTVVIYVSDHGDYAGEHGLWAKGLPCFRGAYHVPMVVRWPKGIKAPGRVVDDLVSLADIAPTLLEVAGIETDRSFVGESLAPFLNNERPHTWRDMCFTQSNGNEQYGIQRSAFSKDFKYVYNGYDYDELYDLRVDPGETRNVADVPEYADVVKEMMTRIWKFAYETGDTCTNSYIMTGLARYGPGVAFQK